MIVDVRFLRPEETRTFLEVHHAAARVTAGAYYSPEVIEAWAPVPITDEMVAQVLAEAAGEIRVAAVSEKRIVGIGVVVPNNCELRACYVAPEAGRSGVGKAIVEELERIASDQGAQYLELDSSLNAEAFYLRMGYQALSRAEHVLGSGHRMACVKMRKGL